MSDEIPSSPTPPGGEFLFYQSEDGRIRLQVRLEDESVWLSLNQMADLFQRDKSVISRHISHIFDEGELVRNRVVAKDDTLLPGAASLLPRLGPGAAAPEKVPPTPKVDLSRNQSASMLCRPGLVKKTLIGGGLFLGLYSVFMVALAVSAPSYIAQVWNLPALSGVLIYDIPLEEFLFGAAFGLYWSGVYEHFTWSESVAHGALH